MRRLARVIAAFALALPTTGLAAHELPGHMVLNGDLNAVVKTVEGASLEVSGRMNAYLVLSGQSFEDGAQVEALNVALFGVDQEALTGKRVRGKPTGVVGFIAVSEEGKRQRLRYDPQSGALAGTIHGRLDMPQFYEMAELRINPEDDVVLIPTMAATVEVRIAVGEMGDLSSAFEKPIETRTEMALTLAARASDVLGVRSFDLTARSRHVEVQLVFWPFIEIARRLCIQPVRILSFNGGFPFFFFNLSGDGLAFGQPGNNTQWAKADVVFTYRDWITRFGSQFSTFSSDEAAALLSTVDVDDCIEVFFVDRFSPQALFGGGATFGGLGQASSKVISSDENADFGVDLTHLAHELGHVLALPHPTAANISSTNTLMCPSGFNNDNPKRNSQENENNLSNPLLTFAIKLVTPGPDCQASADCGPCP